MKKNVGLVEKIVLVAFFLLILVLTFLIAKPYLLTILTASVLAYITYPLYIKVLALVKFKHVAASIMVLFVFLVVAIPMFFLGSLIAKQTAVGLATGFEYIDNVIAQEDCSLNSKTLCTLINQTKAFTTTQIYDTYLKTDFPGLMSPVDSLLQFSSKSFFALTGFLVQFFIMLFALFFFFIDGNLIWEKISLALPMSKRYKDRIIQKFKDTTSGVVYGQLLTSLIQGFVASIGFILFQAPSAIMFGVVTAFTSMIPFLGAVSVWLPLAVIKIVTSTIHNDIGGVWLGIGLGLYGLIFISTVDNIIKPKLIGEKAQLHYFFALIGVLGGISLFGIIGVLLGPIIMSLFVTVFNIYSEYLESAVR